MNGLPFLLPWVRIHRLIRSITSTTWDDATWPKAKDTLRRALEMRREPAQRPEWN